MVSFNCLRTTLLCIFVLPESTLSLTGVTTTIAGGNGTTVSGSADGIGTYAYFKSPRGIAVGISNDVYVSDSSNHLIRMVTSSGVVTTIAGRQAFTVV